jgi:hypothetical protein
MGRWPRQSVNVTSGGGEALLEVPAGVGKVTRAVTGWLKVGEETGTRGAMKRFGLEGIVVKARLVTQACACDSRIGRSLLCGALGGLFKRSADITLRCSAVPRAHV